MSLCLTPNCIRYIEVKGAQSQIEIYIMMLDTLFPGDVLTEEEVMMLINAADKDGDGSLDFQEFVKIMM